MFSPSQTDRPLDPLFEPWFEEVSRLICGATGLSTDDVPDRPYHEWYEAGCSAWEVANELLGELTSLTLIDD